DHDAGEQETEDEKEEVVAGVDRGQPDPDGQRHVPAAQLREAEPSPPRRQGHPRRRKRGGRRPVHSGTGTCSASSRMTRSAAWRATSPAGAARPASTTRCDKHGTHSSFTSSGSTYPRPRNSARACATRKSDSAPRGETPSESSGEERVAATSAST